MLFRGSLEVRDDDEMSQLKQHFHLPDGREVHLYLLYVHWMPFIFSLGSGRSVTHVHHIRDESEMMPPSGRYKGDLPCLLYTWGRCRYETNPCRVLIINIYLLRN